MLVKKLTYYIHTVKYLQLRQIYFRVYYAISKPRIRAKTLIERRSWKISWAAPKWFASPIEKYQFSCFGQTGFFNEPDIWNSTKHSKLWLYNLHYFDALNASDAELQDKQLIEYINLWIAHNQPFVGNGWEPYTLSLRIVNWIKWFAAKNIEPSPTWLISLLTQVQALEAQIEFHLMGNHVLANAKALVFAGVYFSEKQGNQWLIKGLKLLERELNEQFLADGGHFELSPMYHAILIGDVLDLINLAQRTNMPELLNCVSGWREIVTKGIAWLAVMSHPDGEISFFNDAALQIAPTLAYLEQYASQLQINQPINSLNNEIRLHALTASGYYSVELSNQSKAIIDIATVGPNYQPGHAHADTLSFELSLFGQRFLVNSGTSHYENNPLRLFQRATCAHNTVTIQGQNSSEVWSSFRVARRASPLGIITTQNNEQECYIRGAHDGYLRLKESHLHVREWFFSKQSLQIKDEVTGVVTQAEARFYFHPNVKLIGQQNSCFVFLLPNQIEVKMTFFNASIISVEPSFWYPLFGESMANQCLVVQLKDNQLTTLIQWVDR